MLKFILIVIIVKSLVFVSGSDEQRNDDSSASFDTIIPSHPISNINPAINSGSQDISSSSIDDDTTSSTSSSEEYLHQSKGLKKTYFKPLHICGPDEVFSSCVNGGCDRQNCSQLGSPSICIDALPEYCKKGCRCMENFLRNDKGICIPITECSKPKCGHNEVFDFCPATCPPKRCDVDESTIRCKSPPKIGDKECNPSCRCADNYYRTKEGSCVLKSQCPKCHGKDEVYDECPKTCSPQTCESIGSKYNCPLMPAVAVCKPSCRCKPNMFRNKLGECISRQDCLRCRGPNEYFSCGGACDNECDKLSRQNQTSCPIVNITCNKKCYCEPGYARNADNLCVPFSQCPQVCKSNEEYVTNIKAIYRPKTCSESILGLMEYRKDNSITPGCVCVAGYARNRQGVCIPTKDCYADIDYISLDEKDTNVTEALVITAVVYYFIPTPVCGPNEIMSDCINGGCEKQNCSQLGTPDVCRPLIAGHCKKGCRCKENYLRDKNGICIPTTDCPKPTCPGKDEVYEECPKTCPPQTCQSLKAKYKCAPTTAVCKPSCRCKPNMYRNTLGECITKEQCSQCKGNETYVHNVSAKRGPKTCLDLHLPQNLYQSKYRIANIPERPGCVCVDNYVRNDQGICIPAKECPPQCDINEEYINNTSAVCRPQKCSELGYPLDCYKQLDESERDAEPGCICKVGYVRDENGHCIIDEHCPSCGGDPNATRGCGVFCETCNTFKNGPRPCPRICFPNGCKCRKNYVYDSGISRCVLPENCDEFVIFE